MLLFIIQKIEIARKFQGAFIKFFQNHHLFLFVYGQKFPWKFQLSFPDGILDVLWPKSQVVRHSGRLRWILNKILNFRNIWLLILIEIIWFIRIYKLFSFYFYKLLQNKRKSVVWAASVGFGSFVRWSRWYFPGSWKIFPNSLRRFALTSAR